MRLVWAAVLSLCAAAAQGAECQDQLFEGVRYTTCTVDVARDDLRLFLRGPDGEVLGDFRSIDAALAPQGLRLSFAMNAGMYHADRRPVGHYVEAGKEAMRVVTGAGPGNFGLVPNGVFCVREGRADVMETQAFLDAAPRCTHATQSGPMLVISGALHPRFLADGTSRYVRNGVGTSASGDVAFFVISGSAVNFHSFARFFRDVLRTPNALYFDGNVSRLHAPDLSRSDLGRRLGPIIGTVVPR